MRKDEEKERARKERNGAYPGHALAILSVILLGASGYMTWNMGAEIGRTRADVLATWALMLLTLLCLIGVALVIFFLLIKPIRRYNEQLSQFGANACDTRLTPLGSRETQAFAQNINRLLDDLRKTQNDLRLKTEHYRIVMQQSDKYICHYDIRQHTLYRSTAAANLLGSKTIIQDVPDAVARTNVIAPESLDAYYAFYQAMARGEATGSAVMRIHVKPTGAWRWFRSDFTLLFDEQKNPQYAVISFFDVTDRREKEIAYEKWQREISALTEQDGSVYEYNLTRDVLEKQSGAQNQPSTAPTTGFNDCVAYWSARVHPNDRAEFERTFQREMLLGFYYGGTHERSLEYRVKGNAGEFIWMSVSVQMVAYPDSDEIKAYIITRNIDEAKRRQLIERSRAEIDELTGLNNRSAFIRMLQGLFQKKPQDMHAILLIDLDGFKRVNDTLGHGEGDQVLKQVAALLRATLRAEDLLGRLGGDEFVLCMSSIQDVELAARRAQQLCDQIRIDKGQGIQVSGSVGVAMYPENGTDFETLYLHSDAAMYHSKHSGRNRVTFFDQELLGGIGKNVATPIDESRLAQS